MSGINRGSSARKSITDFDYGLKCIVLGDSGGWLQTPVFWDGNRLHNPRQISDAAMMLNYYLIDYCNGR